MCQHTTLAKNSDGFVLWCNECLVYRMHFNSILMVLDVKGLESFKANLCSCYQENRFSQIDRTQKHLFFKTQADGLQLFFSINERLFCQLGPSPLCPKASSYQSEILL